jgi:hypothetical protein
MFKCLPRPPQNSNRRPTYVDTEGKGPNDQTGNPHHSLALAQQLSAEQIQIQVTRIRAERHLHLRRDVFHPHHGERAARDDDDHLPPHEVDEGEGEYAEEEGDGLLEVDAKDDGEGGLAEKG